MNLLIINAILATAVFVAAVGPLLWAIRSHRDGPNVMATPALRLSVMPETGH